MYYRARWYSTELGRFAQPDTDVPESQGVQAWDRFAGLNNNPVRYTDPSGNRVSDGCDTEGCNISFADANYQEKRDYYENCFENPDNPECPRYEEIAIFTIGSLIGAAAIGALTEVFIIELQAYISALFSVLCGDGDCSNESVALQKAIQQGLDSVRNNLGQGYNSFSALKQAFGKAGPNMQWHQIVEQSKTNVGQFGKIMIHNTSNIIALPTGIHQSISSYYSSIVPSVTGTTDLTVRQWLLTQSFVAQWMFGINTTKQFGGAQFIIFSLFGGR
jgi:hypothetical protein